MASVAEITGLYKELLGRAPDQEGLKFYTSWGSADKARQSILGSQEYKNYTTKKSAPKTSAPVSTAAKQASGYQQQSDGLFKDLTSFDKTAQNPVDIYNAALESLGIADARTRVTSLREQMMNTENMLRNVEGNVQARTADSLVTEAQRQRLTAKEQEPIAEQLRTTGQNFELAQGDYGMILAEGTKQAELKYMGQQDKRQAIIDRLEIARDNAKTAEDKRRWEQEIQLQKQKMAEDKRQFEKNYALDERQLAASLAKASRGGGRSGGSSGGSSSGRSSGGGGSSSMAGLDAYFDAQWKKQPYASRQQQDAWINSWFASNGIKDPEDRQQYWNFINSTRKRPEDPTKDWLYKR